MLPLGIISTVFPQNLSLGCIDPWKAQPEVPSAWKAVTGGWWDTCSPMNLNPRSGLWREVEFSRYHKRLPLIRQKIFNMHGLHFKSKQLGPEMSQKATVNFILSGISTAFRKCRTSLVFITNYCFKRNLTHLFANKIKTAWSNKKPF